MVRCYLLKATSCRRHEYEGAEYKRFYQSSVIVGTLRHCLCSVLLVSPEEEEEENTEDQDEHGNLRGLIDDGDVEEEEAEPRSAAENSDSGEEVRHRRRKRSRLLGI